MRISDWSSDVCSSDLGGRGEVDFRRGYPATVNHEAETEVAARVAAALVGDEKVNRNPTPSMGGEDFAYMLNARPGSYIWIGNGRSEERRVGEECVSRCRSRWPPYN